jgi:MFS transporter, FSR family, fosmidomycin resistance protein
LSKIKKASLRQNILEVWDNRSILIGTGLAHFTHDGFADMLYVFFPLWQSQFGLAFAQVGLFKTFFSGTLALFQVPSTFLARRVGPVQLLFAGTLLTSAAMVMCSCATSPFLLGCLLIIGGFGESVQHPLSSTLISNAYLDKETRRTALGIFNTSGDIGKLVFPAAAALVISRFGWPEASQTMGLFGAAVALMLFFLMKPMAPVISRETAGLENDQTKTSLWHGDRAFVVLLAMGILDSATRMGFLTYFPFLLRDKGADIALIGLALSLVFAGGIAGKFLCGILAIQIGVLRTVLITEFMTAVCIWLTIPLSLGAELVMCPILGLSLNGTSSVLYGSVPELVPESKRNHAFAVFYTATIGSGAVSPLLYGFFSDIVGLIPAVIIIGTLILLTLPLTFALRGKLLN